MLSVSISSDLEPALGIRKLTASAVFFCVFFDSVSLGFVKLRLIIKSQGGLFYEQEKCSYLFCPSF